MSQSTSAGTRDVVDILTTDHREMVDLIGQIQTSDAARRRDLADALIAEVMRHAVAEEMYVYPAVEEHVPEGAEKVEHDKQEHQEIVETMKQLEDLDASDPRFMDQVHRLEQQLRHHADDEESEQFPLLRAHISRDELVRIGGKGIA